MTHNIISVYVSSKKQLMVYIIKPVLLKVCLINLPVLNDEYITNILKLKHYLLTDPTSI